MAKFFINRPIVAIVISIIFVIVGIVAILGLPIAQYPDIVPPEIVINTTYVGADAQTVEQSVATPIEQEMSGVDNMNYMYSLNANNGELKLYVNFDVKTDPNIDQVLAQMRKSQADSKLPCRGARLRGHGQEVHLLAAHGGGAVLAERQLRRDLPRQLRLHQPERPAHARARHRQRHRLRRRAVRHAPVGQAGPARQAEHHGAGDRGRHQDSRTRSTRPARSGRSPRRPASSSPTPSGPRAAWRRPRSSHRSSCAPTRTARSCG